MWFSRITFLPEKSLLLPSFSLACTGSIFVSINKSRDEIWCHGNNKCICDNRKNSNAFQNPIPYSCMIRKMCYLQKKNQGPKDFKYCILWSNCPITQKLYSFYQRHWLKIIFLLSSKTSVDQIYVLIGVTQWVASSSKMLMKLWLHQIP